MKTYMLSSLSAPVTKTVAIPGSKSYTNRALLLAALTHEPVRLTNVLKSDDTHAMIACLKTLGIAIEETEKSILVKGSINDIKPHEVTLNADLSGTTIRFITAFCCIVPGVKTITGKLGLKNRPIADLVDALRQLGATIAYIEKEGYPPIRITSDKLSQGTVVIKGSISSQYLSALLMIAPVIGNITIEVEGDQISKPYIAMTLAIMNDFGVVVKNNNYISYEISKPQPYKKKEYVVEGDYSSAGYFFAIAALTKSTITVKNLNPNSLQADKEFVQILQSMGNSITTTNDSVTVKGEQIIPLTVDMNACPDQAQTLAVVASFAKGKTTITGIGSLRVKETERIKALEHELANMGIQTESTESSLTIRGGNPKPATIDTYGDHRMAMAFAVAGSKLSNMHIQNPDVVHKTFPTFWKTIEEVGIGVQSI